MESAEVQRATTGTKPTERTERVGQSEHTRSGEHARKRERDADRARRAILAAAEELFARDGFYGARIDAIAERAGYNKSLIFQYFGDKLGLYQAVVAEMKQRVERELGGIVATYVNGEPSSERVRAFIERATRWSFEHYRAHACDRAILVWETAEGWRTFNCIGGEPAAASRAEAGAEPDLAPVTESGTGPGGMRWHLDASAYLRRAQAAGVVRTDLDSDVLIANAMGMALFYLSSLPRFRLMFPDHDLSAPAALDRAREQLVGLMLHGMMTPEALAASEPGQPGRTTIPTTDSESMSSPKCGEERRDATGL